MMAYSPEQWARAKALFEFGLSLGEISEDCGISKGQISKRSTRENWSKETGKRELKADIVEFDREKETLERKKETLINRVSSLDQFEITILDEIVTNEAGLKSLLFSAQTMAIVRANQALTKGTQTVALKVRDYGADGKVIGESHELVELPLDSSSVKDYTDAIDKASLTLGINQRHAKTEINATAGAQVQTQYVGLRRITPEEREKALTENGRNSTP